MSARTTRTSTMLRLFKNLNLALSANRFQPDIDLVVQSFLKNIVPNRVRDAFQRRDGRQAAFFRGRNKYDFVITADIFVRKQKSVSARRTGTPAHTKTLTAP